MVGAKPVFADVDPASGNITAESIREVISLRTKAIIAVHLAGWPCEMDPILELAREHRLRVIEDCPQAHGAFYKDRPAGSFGHVVTFSFCHDKIVTTGGEGGMLMTDDEALWRRAWSYKDHGQSYDAVYHRRHPPGLRWLHESFGTNWRMTGMQAALGRVQLKRLPEWSARRTRNATQLLEALSRIPALRTPAPPPHVRHAWYRLYTFVKPQWLKGSWTRDRILEAISAEGVPCFTGTCSEVYLERAFVASDLAPAERLPMAKELGETSLAFLVDPSKDDQEMRRTAEVVTRLMSDATLTLNPQSEE